MFTTRRTGDVTQLVCFHASVPSAPPRAAKRLTLAGTAKWLSGGGLPAASPALWPVGTGPGGGRQRAELPGYLRLRADNRHCGQLSGLVDRCSRLLRGFNGACRAALGAVARPNGREFTFLRSRGSSSGLAKRRRHLAAGAGNTTARPFSDVNKQRCICNK